MKRNISIGQAREKVYSHLIEVIFDDKRVISDFKEEFKISNNSDHWWNGLAKRITVERMVEILEDRFDDDFKMIRVKGGWKVSTNENMCITNELCDALWYVFCEEFLKTIV